MTRSAILHEDRAAVDVQFQLLFEQFHVLGVRNETQTSSNPNYLAQWLFHCGYNIFLVKTLIQWPPNVHMVRYKLLKGAFVRKEHFFSLSEFNGDAVWQSLVSFSSSLVSGVAFVPACRTSVQIQCWNVLLLLLRSHCAIFHERCCSSVKERSLIVRWVVGSILHGGLIKLFLVQANAPRLV